MEEQILPSEEFKMTKGILYCVCAEAEAEICDRCEKYKRIKPDHTLNYPAWKRENAQLPENGIDAA